jgi:hypothetical protein
MMDNEEEYQEDPRYFRAQEQLLAVIGRSKRGMTISQITKKVDVPFMADALATLEGQGVVVNKGGVLRPVYQVKHVDPSTATKVCYFCMISRPMKDFKLRGKKDDRVCVSCRKFRTKPKKGK